MRPGEAIEVGDAEYLDLRRQGLLLDSALGSGEPAGTQAGTRMGQMPQTPYWAAGTAEPEQSPSNDPASPETTDAPASPPEGG